MYENDAALRVIAKIQRERDEARDALSRVTVSGAAGGVDAMDVDGHELPEEVAAKVDATQQRYVCSTMGLVLASVQYTEAYHYRRIWHFQNTSAW